MSEIPRITDLTEPPIVGRYYLVPCVRGKWCKKMDNWPVWGSKHDDGRFLNFPWRHYHLDRRFVRDAKDAERAINRPLQEYSPEDGKGYVQNYPLPPPVWRRRKCRSSHGVPFPADLLESRQCRAMSKHYAGQQCTRGRGWICPHKGMDLGAMQPGPEGLIWCPLHGLMIDARTGVVASPPPKRSDNG